MRNLPQLNDITLITVTSVEIERAANALLVSSESCKFGAIKLLSPNKPNILHRTIEHVSIPPIDFTGYSKFMIEELYKVVDTNFCLVVQADGFVTNPSLWTNEFLDYDYVGAPWPSAVQVHNGSISQINFDKNRVGNGGFSLRSKKLLEVCSQVKFDALEFPIKSEDLIICHFLFEEMCKVGIRFAPLQLASRFSIESPIDRHANSLALSFGFHGKHWLADDYLLTLATQSCHSEEFSSLLRRRPSADTFPTLSNNLNRVGRLEPCPCGSAKRFKDCHGKLV